MNETTLNSIQLKLKTLGDLPGVYLWKNSENQVIYVGKAIKLRQRIRSYLNPKGLDMKTLSLHFEISDLDWMITNNEVEALILEANLIKKFNPKYNIRLKDDKKYPFLCISTDEMYPRIFLTRNVRSDGKKYFGPFTDVRATRELLALIQKIFPIRKTPLSLPVKKPVRPCLNFHIKRCLAPCQGNVPVEEYSEIINQIIDFLSGNKSGLIKQLRQKMVSYSENLSFEKAAVYRDTIESLGQYNSKQAIVNTNLADEDVLALYCKEKNAQIVVFEIREGKLNGKKSFALDGISEDESKEKEIYSSFIKLYYFSNFFIPGKIKIPVSKDKEIDKLESTLSLIAQKKISIHSPLRGSSFPVFKMAKLTAEKDLMERVLATKYRSMEAAMEDLQKKLNLPNLPKHIECYDISHFQGSQPVASGVMFLNGEPHKPGYRHYVMRGYDSINDPGMIHEVISRRLQRLMNENKPYPDLIVIDGGQTQLSRAVEAALSLDLGQLLFIGLAKKREEVYFPGETEPYQFPLNDPGIRLIRRLRNEAHRFAITFHRKRRNKNTYQSILDGIPNLGVKRKKDILEKFQGVKRIDSLSVEDLAGINGISISLAEKIHSKIQENKP
ncbi:MAG: excinuclease ABC subunit UvrC [Leptospiraceae bacterium]|nr:excinuclease ABC subunit UvrC [Leptospiraceae bacterium]MCP5511907.1 excinuclease ABC subunit UvrC [Leptospiraceae bacterium]